MANFFLRTNKQSGRATIYVRVQKPKLGIDWRSVNTGIETDVSKWRECYESGNVKKWDRYTSEGVGKELKERLDTISQTINLLFEEKTIKSNADKHILEERLFSLANHEAISVREDIRKHEREEKERLMHEILPCCEKFIIGIKDGTIPDSRTGRAYTEGTIKCWGTFYGYMKRYCKDGTTFEEIDIDFINGFRNFLKKQGLMGTTINKHFGTAGKLCRYAAERGWNKNAVSLAGWKAMVVQKDEKQTEIYLNEEELNALYDMQLTGQREQVRDIFFLGVFTGQRVSDYSIYNERSFAFTEAGTPVVKLTQKKTGVPVEVPILDSRLYDLCDKYGKHFPQVPLQRINLVLKSILKDLAQSVPSLMTEYTTAMTRREHDAEKTYLRLCQKVNNGEELTNNERADYRRMKEYAHEHDGDPVYRRNGKDTIVKYKYELVNSHTARRSAITNWSKSGIFTKRDIMKMSGHQSEANYEKYIKVGISEAADQIAAKAKKAKEVQLKKEA